MMSVLAVIAMFMSLSFLILPEVKQDAREETANHLYDKLYQTAGTAEDKEAFLAVIKKLKGYEALIEKIEREILSMRIDQAKSVEELDTLLTVKVREDRYLTERILERKIKLLHK